MKNLWRFFMEYFGFGKKDDFEHKDIKVLISKDKKLLIIPEHWIKELFLIRKERELKIAFSQSEEPITIFFSKDAPKEKELTEEKIKLPMEDFIIHQFFLLKALKKLSSKVFRYNYQKNKFTPY